MRAGILETVPAMNVNRLCGTGVQAVVSAAQSLMLGDSEFAVAGGAESMSRSPFIMPDQRWSAKMGDVKSLDMKLEALTCAFGSGHMGVTAENVAREHGISREAQDALALESQQRAAKAAKADYFMREITPVTVTVKRQEVVFDTDEHPKPNTAETLAGLRAVFEKDGAVTAVRTPFDRTGLTAEDFDVIESSEAFAAQALTVSQELCLDPAKVNRNGVAIRLAPQALSSRSKRCMNWNGPATARRSSPRVSAAVRASPWPSNASSLRASPVRRQVCRHRSARDHGGSPRSRTPLGLGGLRSGSP